MVRLYLLHMSGNRTSKGWMRVACAESWAPLTKWVMNRLPLPRGISYSWLYICPDQSRKNHLEECYRKHHDLKTLAAPPFITREAFLQELILRVYPGRFSLTEMEELYLVHLAGMHQGDSQEPSSGWVQETHRFIHTLQLNGYSEQTLQSLPEQTPALRRLCSAFSAYQQLKSNRFLDRAEALRLLNENLNQEHLEHLYPGIQAIFWEVPEPLPGRLFRFLKSLVDMGIDLQILLRFSRNPDLFGNLYPFLQFLSKQGIAITPIEEGTRLSDTLYCLSGKPLHPPSPIHIHRLPHRMAEMDWIARRIKTLCADEGLQPEEIGFSAPNLDTYLPLLKNTLCNYGIPFRICLPERLDRLVIIQHIRLFLELVIENFPLQTLLKIFQSHYLNYRQKLEGVDAETVLKRLRVWTGLEAMRQQIQRFLDSGILETDRESGEADPGVSVLEQFRRVKDCLELLHRETAELTGTLPARKFVQFVENLLQTHRVNHKLLHVAESLSLATGAEHLAALRTLMQNLYAWAQFIEGVSPERRFTAWQLLQVFDAITQNSRISPTLPESAGVLVFPLTRIHAHAVKVLFVAGMTDSDFPTGEVTPLSYLPEPVAGLFPRQQIFRDRQTFLECLHQPEQMLYLSYPYRDGETVNVPSEAIREIRRTTDIDITDPAPLPVPTSMEIIQRLERCPETKRASWIASLDDHFPGKRFNVYLYRIKQQIVLQRRQGTTSSRYEGILTHNRTIREYMIKRFRNSLFSASALETYARCPQLFFLQRLLAIKPPEEWSGFITPIEKGNLVHQTLFRFYSEVPPEQRNGQVLQQIAEEEFQKLPLPSGLFRDLQKAVFLGDTYRKGLFQAFYEKESARLEALKATPTHLELPFGHPAESSDALPAFTLEREGCRIAFRGVIDRIDILDNKAVLIIDYKTGSIPTPDDVVNGLSLQLPVYLLAVQRLMPPPSGHPPFLGAAYYQISRENEIRFVPFLMDSAVIRDLVPGIKPKAFYSADGRQLDFSQVLEITQQWIVRYSQELGLGRFPHTTNLSHCQTGKRRCPYEAICRINPHKMRTIAARTTPEHPGQM